MAMIVFAGAVAAGATGAFFSDTETSTGNTFTAGAIDLQVDNESYVTNNEGVLVASPDNTWSLSDLTGKVFFSFIDLKPGDIGEDTISLHPGANNAWACMAIETTSMPENVVLETESGDPTPADGELQNYLNFAFWHDDGDNVFEQGEQTFWVGGASTTFDGSWRAIADSTHGVALATTTNTYVGKAWCFGTLTPNPDDSGLDIDPVTRGTTGFTCVGSGNQNDAQTDGIVADVSFYAEQTRNNSTFTCSSLNNPI